MTDYDWIVIGAGITGSALAYELSKKSFQVLLLEKDPIPDNATCYSYGGLAYWSGTTELTRQLGREGIELHRNLSEELEADTEFRELDLVLTIEAKDDPQTVAKSYSQFAITPELLDVKAACELEPLLNPKAIAGVLKLPHGHIHSQKTAKAYQQAFRRRGGEIKYEQVIELIRQENRSEGVKTAKNTYYATNTVVCAGGLTRSLLHQVGLSVPNYFTHAQLIKTPPVDIKLRTLVMPAVQQRFALEAMASNSEIQPLWDKPNSTSVASIFDAGAIQFLDGSFCIGQISALVTDPKAKLETSTAEVLIRNRIARILPSLSKIPGTCHHCLVAFTNKSIALVGNLKNKSAEGKNRQAPSFNGGEPVTGIYLFSGFTSTLVFAPPLARRFANWVVGEEDEILELLNNQLTTKPSLIGNS
ncbi:FAD-binding oxidoreductase [Pleurocapsales cyanobacterium LEGE 06147]|nr:FAD-binding oxidoreductase [Pleurocapsales cyanobacterium LEGE 06147]